MKATLYPSHHQPGIYVHLRTSNIFLEQFIIRKFKVCDYKNILEDEISERPKRTWMHHRMYYNRHMQ